MNKKKSLSKSCLELPENYSEFETISKENSKYSSSIRWKVGLFSILLAVLSIIAIYYPYKKYFGEISLIYSNEIFAKLFALIIVFFFAFFFCSFLRCVIQRGLFWLFGRDKGKFGFKRFFLYIACSNLYFSRNIFLFITIIPSIIISFISFFILNVYNLGGYFTSIALVLIISNILFAYDIYIVGQLLKKGSVYNYVKDFGLYVKLYKQKNGI